MLIGLIGKPNVGKSTFFKAATLSDVLIANYPFATIKPNHAIAYVKIEDLAVEFGRHSNPREGFVKEDWRFVPFEMADVAGLVEGASEGKGLGNEFLNDLSSADALIMVVDMSGETDAEGKSIGDGSYYPGEDVRMIERELDKWYFGIFKKVWDVFVRNMKLQKLDFKKGVAKQFSGLKVSDDDVKEVVSTEKINIAGADKWSSDELMKFARALRRHTKPMIIAANKMDRPNAESNFEKVKKEFDYPIVACSAEYELTLRQADRNKMINYVPGEKVFEIVGKLSGKQLEALNNVKGFLKENSTGVQEVLNKVVFDVLKYVAVYPAGAKLTDSKGNVLPDCYLMPPGSTVLDFAFRLHTDIGKGFVKAIDIKTKKGVGKEHVIKSGDGYEIMIK